MNTALDHLLLKLLHLSSHFAKIFDLLASLLWIYFENEANPSSVSMRAGGGSQGPSCAHVHIRNPAQHIGWLEPSSRRTAFRALCPSWYFFRARRLGLSERRRLVR